MPLLWLLISLSPSLSLPSATQSHTSTRVTALFQLSSWAEIRKGSRLFCSCESLVQSMRNFYTLLPVIMNESAAYSPMKTVSLCSASRQVALAPVPHAQHAQAQDQCLSLCPQIPWYSTFLLNGPVEGFLLDYGDLRVVALRPPSLLLHIFLLLEHYAYRDNSWFHLIFH